MGMNTTKDRDLPLQLARQGVPFSEIGRRMGYSRQRAAYIARRAGISRLPQKGWHNRKDAEGKALYAAWLQSQRVQKRYEAILNGYRVPKDPDTLAAMDRLAANIHAIVTGAAEAYERFAAEATA